MSRSAWAKFATYISFHGGLFLGPMNDGAPFVEMFRLLISEEECELGVFEKNARPGGMLMISYTAVPKLKERRRCGRHRLSDR